MNRLRYGLSMGPFGYQYKHLEGRHIIRETNAVLIFTSKLNLSRYILHKGYLCICTSELCDDLRSTEWLWTVYLLNYRYSSENVKGVTLLTSSEQLYYHRTLLAQCIHKILQASEDSVFSLTEYLTYVHNTLIVKCWEREQKRAKKV